MKRWRGFCRFCRRLALSAGSKGEKARKKFDRGQDFSRGVENGKLNAQGGSTVSDIVRTTVAVYGEEYQLKTDLPEEHVQALGRLVDSRIRSLAARHPRVAASRLAVLAAMTLAEELVKLKAEHEEALQALQARWRREKSALRSSKA